MSREKIFCVQNKAMKEKFKILFIFSIIIIMKSMKIKLECFPSVYEQKCYTTKMGMFNIRHYSTTTKTAQIQTTTTKTAKISESYKLKIHGLRMRMYHHALVCGHGGILFGTRFGRRKRICQVGVCEWGEFLHGAMHARHESVDKRNRQMDMRSTIRSLGYGRILL